MNKIIYTQDVPGERAWLAKKFPDFENLETEFGGKWPPVPFHNLQNTIWEIPPDSHVDISNVDCDKYKSLYQLDTKFISPKWCDSNLLLLNKLDFTAQPRAKKAQVLTFSRCGTAFLESILYGPCGYDKDRGWNKLDPRGDHAFLGGNDTLLYNLIEKSQPDIFLCYRNNWWGWATSVLIAKIFDYFHYYDSVLWEKLKPFEILAQDLDKLAAEVRANWQSLCHFRTQFPHLNFYIIEFSELIKNADLTNHQGIEYNKKHLITNYDQAQMLFNTTHLPKFNQWQNNCLGHLQTMKCQIITNFDKLIG
jgi:hypothetical protein